MWQRLKRLRRGEKVVFGIVIGLIVMTVSSYAILEVKQAGSDKPMFPIRTHYEFAGEGFLGSELFRKNNCIACHRAIGNGSNMSLNLDGIGSRRTLAYLIAFLGDPEANYPSRTVDHGPAPKEAAYVARMAEPDRHAIAVFLSQLRTDQGGASAELPPPEKSTFIDAMLDMWAPDGWRIMFSDVRKGHGAPAAGADPGASTSGASDGKDSSNTGGGAAPAPAHADGAPAEPPPRETK